MRRVMDVHGQRSHVRQCRDLQLGPGYLSIQRLHHLLRQREHVQRQRNMFERQHLWRRQHDLYRERDMQ